jgi:hypothetical protein
LHYNLILRFAIDVNLLAAYPHSWVSISVTL